ncbi:MAG: type II secretion system F family protein [Desulfobulbaceae bacterium]|nr:type II secretion system F family protein [Desulfobulbaceae bacterium]
MDEYTYEAYNRQGKKLTGVELGSASQEIESMLLARGLMPKKIRKRSRLLRSLILQKRTSDLDIQIFNNELISLLTSGISIPDAIAILCDDNTFLAKHLLRVLNKVKSGMSLSLSFRTEEGVFPVLFVSAIEIGENSGDMLTSLKSYQKHMERVLDLKRKIGNALVYPMFLLITFSIIITLLFVYVIPSFVEMYDDLEIEMPVATLWLVAIVSNGYVFVVVIVLSLVGLFWIFKYMKSSKNGRIAFDRVKESIPIYGHIYRLITFWQFTQSLSVLLRSGESILNSLRVASSVVDNHNFSFCMEKVIKRVESGEKVSKCLVEETEYPKKSGKIMSIGEESGEFASMIESVSLNFSSELDDEVKKISTLVEPVMMLLIGGVVGFVIVSLYLPVFGMVNVLG